MAEKELFGVTWSVELEGLMPAHKEVHYGMVFTDAGTYTTGKTRCIFR